ncbi:tRNA (uracil-5-)-methyltransferase homolog A-like [Schistocerca nitens]|uniref:tRNA (uracil-5-)-methyltransferase homolog A-like n=1 Tax=Schistocerca nitens TaxID=7011 RepID=UPI00211952E1|nr:tRNA (uracil-5-)-methyltransferase homolog A-like [Schistocerca nitens]
MAAATIKTEPMDVDEGGNQTPAQPASESAPAANGEVEMKTPKEESSSEKEKQAATEESKTGDEKEAEAAKVNGEGDADGEVDNEDKEPMKVSGTYKIKVSGLPRFCPLGEFKKLVKEELGLALSYVRCPKRGNPWLHLTFNTPEEQHRAQKALHKYTWKRKTLTCSIVTTDAQKRKPEDSTGDDSDAKKAKLDLSVEERVLMATIPYHNIPYEEQLKKKTEELKAMATRLGDLIVRRNPELAGWAEQQREKHDGLVFQLDEIRPSPVTDAYRNKCEFRIGLNPDTQERTVGCRLENYKDGSMGVGPADSLKHLPDQMREAVKLFQDYIRKSDKEPFSIEQRQGYWRHLVVRVTSSGEMMIVVVAHPQQLSEEELTKMKDDIRDYFVNGEGRACNVTSLYFQKFTEKLIGVPLPDMDHLYGKTHLEEVMLDLTFRLSPSSYFQVNTKGGEVLYSAIIELVEPTEETTVLDLCCGTGGIGLCIAKKCGQVFGIEYLEQNIEDAKKNAEINEITNCEFIAGRAEDALPTLEPKITGKHVVPILDPPRTGLNQKVMQQLRKMENVQKLIYVCSNHKAPIRNFLDLCCPAGKNGMTGHPFVPTRTIPVDVVPHTMHAQMAMLLERVDPATLPKAKHPIPRGVRKPLRGRTGRGGLKVGMMGRGRGGRMRGGMPGMMPIGGPSMRGMRGGMRGGMRSVPVARGMAPRPYPSAPGLLDHPRDFGRPLRARDMYDDGYGPTPLLERDYLPPPLTQSAYHGGRRGPDHRRGLDFSSDELTLSRYSDFRRDVEDAIDSSFSPRMGGRNVRPLLAGGPAAVTAATMLEREEMAYRAGLTRGLVGAAAFTPQPLYPQYHSAQSTSSGIPFKGSRSGGKRGGRDTRGRRGSRGAGGRGGGRGGRR